MQLAGWKLRDILEEEGLSQREAAERYGVHQSQISKYLNGKHLPVAAASKIDEDYARLFGQDAAPSNPLPARMTRRLRTLPQEDLHQVLIAIAAILALKP
jgi:transcriptional regulator with XRE-family HTH domain